jgi:radical SAM protein with 4Fe4S-binding SPASM domain
MVYGIENNIIKKGLKQCWLDIAKLYTAALSQSIDKACSSCLAKPGCPGGCPAEHEEFARRGEPSASGHCRFYKAMEKR